MRYVDDRLQRSGISGDQQTDRFAVHVDEPDYGRYLNARISRSNDVPQTLVLRYDWV
jgi:hypothetical protein